MYNNRYRSVDAVAARSRRPKSQVYLIPAYGYNMFIYRGHVSASVILLRYYIIITI